MLQLRTALLTLGLLLLATALPACSLFGSEPYPRAEEAFRYTFRPSFTCTPSECGWAMETELVAKADSSYGFGEGYTPFITLDLTDHALDLVGTGTEAAGLPLVVGRRYDFETDALFFGLGAPNPSALRVSDDDGLVFYGVSAAVLPGTDTTGAGFDRVLLLPDGWALRFEDTGREGEVFCGTATAYRATVEHDGSRIRLLQGERGRLGDYEVQVRAARRILYDGSCLDGYQHEFSIVVARRSS